MLVSKVTIAIGACVFCSLTRHARLFVPTNLVANLNARKRSDAATISKKGRYLYLYQPPSEIRPLAVCWGWMLLETGAREADLRLYSLVPLRIFGDRCMTVHSVFYCWLGLPRAPARGWDSVKGRFVL